MANEDFTTYTEVDAGNDITVITSKVSWVDLNRNVESYVYKDHGVNHFSGDWSHKYTLQHDNEAAEPIFAYWMLANDINDFAGLEVADEDGQGIYYFNGLTFLFVMEGGEIRNDSYNSVDGTVYYITFDRDDDGGANNTGQLVAYIRTGSHGGNLEDTLTVDCAAGEQNDFRYGYAVSAYKLIDLGNEADGYIEDLDLQEGAPPANAPTGALSGALAGALGGPI